MTPELRATLERATQHRYGTVRVYSQIGGPRPWLVKLYDTRTGGVIGRVTGRTHDEARDLMDEIDFGDNETPPAAA